MAVRFTCPFCNRSFESPDGMAGQHTSCPGCANTILLPNKQANPPALLTTSPATGFGVPPVPLKTSGLAIASMILGILGIMGGWACCGIVLPVLAIVFGHVSYSKIAKHPTVLTGKGFAVAGFTMGYIGLAFGLAASLALGSFSAILAEVAKQLQQTGLSGLKP